ncbi:MAG: diacylglycerol/lipid kinase family protein [Chthoniobacterales bacterium]
MLVILNGGAGPGSGDAPIAARIAAAFAPLGVNPRIVQPDHTQNISALAREGASSSEETIVAAGGDGTVNAVAAELAGTDKILGVLPLGTLNHFAKDLHIPFALEDAARTVVEGHVAPVDVAEVNGRIFINNSSLGLYPRIVSQREAQQHRLARGKWAAFFWATVQAFHRFPFLNLRINFEGKRLTRRSAFLFVGNNPYEIAGFKLGGRSTLNSGKLGLYLTHRTGRLGLFRLALRALFGRVDQAKDFEAFRVEEATIEARKPRLLVATDGEVNWMEAPLLYRTRPNALRVIVPRNSEPA